MSEEINNITDKLLYLNETKQMIKSAIQNQGITVQDSDTFRSYADKINSIEGGELISNLSIGMSTYCPEPLTSNSWLKSEGRWNNGNSYPAFYNHYVNSATQEIKNGAKLKTEEYNDYDIVIDLETETFRLPLLNGEESYADLGSIPENIPIEEYGHTYVISRNGFFYANIAKDQSNTNHAQIWAEGKDSLGNRIWFDGRSWLNGYAQFQFPLCRANTVMRFFYANINLTNENNKLIFIPAVGNGDLYYYVGNTLVSTDEINIDEITNEINNIKDELELKADKTELDGNYTKINSSSIVSNLNLSLEAGVSQDLDISQYLPEDDNSYLINSFLNVQTGSNLGDYTHVWTSSSDDIIGISAGGNTTSNVRATHLNRGYTLINPDRILRLYYSCTGKEAGILRVLQITDYKKLGDK